MLFVALDSELRPMLLVQILKVPCPWVQPTPVASVSPV
eukprot:COSAG01_NODE_65299_length_273_cov_2.534483_1_plen_37_part_01